MGSLHLRKYRDSTDCEWSSDVMVTGVVLLDTYVVKELSILIGGQGGSLGILTQESTFMNQLCAEMRPHRYNNPKEPKPLSQRNFFQKNWLIIGE